jgi:flagellar hook assembly protein FlgD
VQAKPASAPNLLAGVLLAAVLVAALASLAVIQEARQRGEVLDLVEVSPRGISPSDSRERVRIEWRQRRTSDDAVVQIVTSAERPVATLLDGGMLTGDDTQQVFHWDGRRDSGRVADPGHYWVRILLRDQDRDIIPEQGRMTVRSSAEDPADQGEG